MSEPTRLALYDGRTRMGSISISAKGRAAAVDAAGKKLGTFKSRKLALAAISSRYLPRPRGADSE